MKKTTTSEQLRDAIVEALPRLEPVDLQAVLRAAIRTKPARRTRSRSRIRDLGPALGRAADANETHSPVDIHPHPAYNAYITNQGSHHVKRSR